MLATIAALAAPAYAATPLPFNPAQPMIFLAQGNPTHLEGVVESNGKLVFNQIGPAATFEYNAIGYDPADNFIYGVAITGPFADHLIQIGQNNVIADTGINLGAAYITGAFGPNGNFYALGSPSKEVNVATKTVTTFPGVAHAPDMTYADGFFWGMPNTNQLERMDATTGADTLFAVAASVLPGASGASGAAWTFGNGNIGFSNNATGNVYELSITNPSAASPTFKLVASQAGPASANNDGTNSPGEPTDLAVTKQASPTSADAGQHVTFTETVTDNGPGDSSGYVLDDPLPAGFTHIVASPAAPICSVTGQQVKCNGNPLTVGASATYTITADAPTPFPAAVTNTATVTPNESDPDLSNNTASATVDPDTPAVSVQKQALVTPAADQGAAQVGDVIAYQYTVTNTGNEPLASVAVQDASTAVSCPPVGPGGLAVGAAITCNSDSTHIVTQADVDAGSITDTATATGTDPNNVTSPKSAQSMATVDTVAPAPSLSLQKVPDASIGNGTPVQVGETISYSYVVTNTGNVDMTSISVSDSKIGAVNCPALTAPGLAPGATTTCTSAKSYTVTQSDVDNKGVTDTATSSGKDPSGNTITSNQAMAQVPSSPAPMVSIDKTATVTPSADQNAAKVGDTIAYSYTVTNSGNVTLASVSVIDPSAGAVMCPPPAAPGLAPGASETCTASSPHTVTQADVDAGSVVDTATATGTDTQGNVSQPSKPSTATVDTVPPVITVSVVKSDTVTPSGDTNAVKVGDTINYSYRVTNTGNVDLKTVTVTDPSLGPVNCPAPSAPGLAPGASETCTADNTYTVTQADVDAGSVTDTATATGTDPGGVTGPPSKPSTVTVDAVAPAPSTSTTKSASVTPAADDGKVKVGDSIYYSYVVKNTGNVTLASVSVSDATAGAVTCPTPAPPGLAPGASETCQANSPHVVTQADVDSGSVVDTATSTGTDTHGHKSKPSNPSKITENAVPPVAKLTLTKVAAATKGDLNSPLRAGDTIQYFYVLKNTGNVTLSSLGVTDDLMPSLTVSCPSSTLAPDASEECKATTLYTVTAAEASANKVADTATVNGKDPKGNTVTAQGSATVPAITPMPAVTIAKTATTPHPSAIAVGDPIGYTYVVTNTGNVPLQTITVSDPTAGTVNCNALPKGGLPPGGTVDCAAAAAVIVAQGDVDAGHLTDTAKATGVDTADKLTVTGTDHATVYSAPSPQVTIAKTATVTPAGDQKAVKVGDKIAYTYKVTNSGNVTLASIDVSDPSAGAVTCPSLGSGLAPGKAVTCSANASHTVTQTDVDNGLVTDTATGTGTDKLGNKTPKVTSTVTVDTVPPNPNLSIQKQSTVSPAGDTGALKVGDTISYTYVVTNTGNVDLTSIAVTDSTLGNVKCPAPATPGLAPGKSETCTASNTYTVTQADVDKGGVSDRSTAIGIDPNHHRTPTGVSTNTQMSSPAPGVSVVKTATVSPAADQTAAKLGDKISYSFAVTNTGNVDLASVAVSDGSLGPVNCPVPAAPGLAPGASETCTGEAQHVVSEGDVQAGKFSNTATATGTTTTGVTSPPSQPSTATVTMAPPVSNLVVTKTVNKKTALPGTKLTYTITVKNDGPDQATSAKLTDKPSIPMDVLSIHTSVGSCTKGATITCSFGTLAVDQTVKITITAKVLKAGTERNVATATSASKDLDPRHSVASATTKIVPILIVRKKASTRSAKPGSNVTYRITITNPTVIAIAKVKVCDQLPGGLLFVHASAGAHASGHNYCWKLSRIAAHHTVTRTLVANVAPGKGGSVTNRATAGAPGIKTVRASARVRLSGAAPVPCASASRAAIGGLGPVARAAC